MALSKAVLRSVQAPRMVLPSTAITVLPSTVLIRIHPEHQAGIEAIRVQALKHPADRGLRQQLLPYSPDPVPPSQRGSNRWCAPRSPSGSDTRYRQGQDREADSDLSRVCPWDPSRSGGHGPQTGVMGRWWVDGISAGSPGLGLIRHHSSPPAGPAPPSQRHTNPCQNIPAPPPTDFADPLHR